MINKVVIVGWQFSSRVCHQNYA